MNISVDAKILVTGGAGFIGSCVVRKLLKKGYGNVCVLDNFSTSLRGSIPSGCVVIEGDVREKEDLSLLPEDIEFVIHLAAATSVEESFVRPEFYLQNNVCGTLNLLDWGRENGIVKFVYTSSAAVYGNVNEDVIMHEELLPNPINLYALTKLDGEFLVRMYNANFGLDFAVLRYFNVFGQGQDCESAYASVIPKFINLALSEKDLTVYGTGEQTRDFVHVEDAADATILALTKGRGVYNVASGEQYDVNAIARLILQYTGSKSGIAHCPPIPGDTMCDNGCNRKLTELSWSRTAGFQERLEQTVRWYEDRFHPRSSDNKKPREDT